MNDMSSGPSVEINITFHRNNLEPEAEPMMQHSCPTGPKVREIVVGEVDCMIKSKIFDPPFLNGRRSKSFCLRSTGVIAFLLITESLM